MKLLVLICGLMLAAVTAVAQPVVSYITPDAGAPGMCVAIEIFAPASATGSFGADGLCSPDSIVQLVNASDLKYVRLGPSVVSWNGRVIQQMIMIESSDTVQLSIPLKVVINSRSSAPFNFNIIYPVPHLGIVSGNHVIGQAPLVPRTSQNTIVVDSMILDTGTFTCYFQDPDLNTPGNQAYLPLRILSLGPIRLNNATLQASGQNGTTGNSGGSVSGTGGNGGAGGGGGGGGYPAKGGDGYTGGGGDNDALTSEGVGSGSPNGTRYNGGSSLNGASGGNGELHSGFGGDDGGGGGTGHPFGSSGSAGSGGGSPGGGNGAGSAGGSSGPPFYSNNYGGGGGGYATAGSPGQGTGDNSGHAFGDPTLVPLAGGSGGGAGNLTYSTLFGGNADGGCGGGGGGAIELTSFASFTDPQGGIAANGGNGSNGVPHSNEAAAGGGGGSGGAISIGARDSIVFGASGSTSVTGGTGGSGSPSSAGGSGGLGRIRLDGYISKVSGNVSGTSYYSAAKDYPGPSIQSVKFLSDTTFMVIGHGGSWDGSPSTPMNIAIWWTWPSLGGSWNIIGPNYVTDAKSHSLEWTSDTLPIPSGPTDTEVYIVALQDDPTGNTQIMGHTSGIIAKIAKPPKVLTFTTGFGFGKELVGKCSHDTSFMIYSVGQSDLTVTGFTITGPDAADFQVRTTAPQTVKVGDSLKITLAFCPLTLGCPKRAVLHIFTNDVTVNVDLTGCAVQPFATLTPNILNFGTVKKGNCKDSTISIVNTGTGPLTITNEVLPNPPFQALDVLPKTIQPDSSLVLHIRFCPKDSLFVQDPDSVVSDNPANLVITLIGNTPVKQGILSVAQIVDFGAVHKGDCKDSGFYALNVGDDTLHVTMPIISGTGFTIISPSSAFSIKPHDSLWIALRYCSSDSGNATGLATLNTTIPTQGSVVLKAFTGLGVLSIAQVIDFGIVPVGSCRDTIVSIQNIGTDTLLLKGANAFSPPFYYTGSDPVSMAPGQNTTISLRFCPTDSTEAVENVQLDTMRAGNSTPFQVRGGGKFGTLSLSGNPVNFGCLTTAMIAHWTIGVHNPSSGELILSSVKFLSGKNVTVTQNPRDTLPSGGSDSIVLSASSAVPDTVYGVLEVQYKGSPPIDVPISGRISPPAKITALDTLLSFDSVTVGDTSIDTCVRVTNYSCAPIDAKIAIVGTGSTAFRIVSSSLPVLADSAIAKVCIQYIPDQAGTQTATLLAINNTDTIIAATLSGVGRGKFVGVQLSIDTIFGRPGQTVLDPVRVLNDITQAAITTVIFRVQFDPMQLDMKPPTVPLTSSIQHVMSGNPTPSYGLKKYSLGDWEITATYPSPISGKPVIANLPFEILMPKASIAPVHLLNASFGTSPATLSSGTDGQVHIEQCDTTEQFGAALPSAIKVSQNSPNPFNPRTSVHIEVLRAGHVKIEVLNLLGQTVLVPFEDEVPSGERNIEIDAGMLPSGVYRYVTTWSGLGDPIRDEKSMVIVK